MGFGWEEWTVLGSNFKDKNCLFVCLFVFYTMVVVLEKKNALHKALET